MRSATSGRERWTGTCQRSAAGTRHTPPPLVVSVSPPVNGNALFRVAMKPPPTPLSSFLFEFERLLMTFTLAVLVDFLNSFTDLSTNPRKSAAGICYLDILFANDDDLSIKRSERCWLYRRTWRHVLRIDQPERCYGSSSSSSSSFGSVSESSAAIREVHTVISAPVWLTSNGLRGRCQKAVVLRRRITDRLTVTPVAGRTNPDERSTQLSVWCRRRRRRRRHALDSCQSLDRCHGNRSSGNAIGQPPARTWCTTLRV